MEVELGHGFPHHGASVGAPPSKEGNTEGLRVSTVLSFRVLDSPKLLGSVLRAGSGSAGATKTQVCLRQNAPPVVYSSPFSHSDSGSSRYTSPCDNRGR